VRAGGDEQDGAFRRVGFIGAGDLQQSSQPTRALRTRRERGYGGHGIIVCGDDDNLVLEFGVGAFQPSDDVTRGASLPGHVTEQRAFHLALLCGERKQGRGVALADIKARNGHRDTDELGLRLAAHGGIGLDKDDRLRSQSRRVQPVGTAVEIHQHDAAFHVLPAEVGQFAVARVDDGSRDAFWWQLRGSHQIGPHRIQRELTVTHAQFRALVYGNGNCELLRSHPLQSNLAELLLNPLRCRFRARIPCDARGI
jgi:hypothetical protein